MSMTRREALLLVMGGKALAAAKYARLTVKAPSHDALSSETSAGMATNLEAGKNLGEASKEAPLVTESRKRGPEVVSERRVKVRSGGGPLETQPLGDYEDVDSERILGDPISRSFPLRREDFVSPLEKACERNVELFNIASNLEKEVTRLRESLSLRETRDQEVNSLIEAAERRAFSAELREKERERENSSLKEKLEKALEDLKTEEGLKATADNLRATAESEVSTLKERMKVLNDSLANVRPEVEIIEAFKSSSEYMIVVAVESIDRAPEIVEAARIFFEGNLARPIEEWKAFYKDYVDNLED